MKHLAYFLVIVTFLISCNYESDKLNTSPIPTQKEQVNSYTPNQMRGMLLELQSPKRLPEWVRAIADWIRDQFGRDAELGQPSGCSGSGGCGPCSGFCDGKSHFGGTSNNGSSTLSQSNYSAGFRLYKLTLMYNQQTAEKRLLFEFSQNSEFINSNNELVIPQDIYFSPQMTQLYNQNSIQLKAGVYPVIFNSNSANTLGQTLVDAVIN